MPGAILLPLVTLASPATAQRYLTGPGVALTLAQTITDLTYRCEERFTNKTLLWELLC